MKDGHLNICKTCVRANVGKHRELNIDRIREYDRGRSRQEDGSFRSDKWQEQNPDRKNLTKLNSNRVMAAVKKGILKKSEACEKCGTSGVFIEASHHDYSKPLDVTWLCRPCHRKLDRANPKTANV